MTIDRKLSSIEASFNMENMPFDDECRERVRKVLNKEITIEDAIEELNKKYNVLKKQNGRSGI